MNNSKKTSPEMGSVASRTLRDPNASDIQRSLAASNLAQCRTSKQTGEVMEARAGRALQNEHSADLTKSLAAGLVSQSNKNR